jgi:microcystin-dependent protein
MSNPYVGEIRMFGGNFAPAGWMFCQGQLLPISEYETLFQLIGTTYGGDGQETFGLPNMASRIPVHMGQGPGISQNYQIGEVGGVESVLLTQQNVPIHSHAFQASSGTGLAAQPESNVLAASRDYKTFATNPSPTAPMAAGSIVPTGGSQPHENMGPYQCVSFIISLFGIFPSPT